MPTSWEAYAALQGGAALFLAAAFGITPLPDNVCVSIAVRMAVGSGMRSCACSEPCCKANLLRTSACLLGSLLPVFSMGLCSANLLDAVPGAGALSATGSMNKLSFACKSAIPVRSPWARLQSCHTHP